ncbi:MAG: aminotransferase class V-fold PLP-dependent enzyme [Cyclobacteriaceae bacterium]|nr:aminotransferase class V-fold PLP-dependent enzyme [Cyclobacteriaceae bacterium]
MNRREIIKSLSVLPFTGGLLYQDELLGSTVSATQDNIYRSIGVEPVINCRGTFTIIGGSIERPQVLEAQEAASGQFVQYDELAYGIGKRLAEITKSEWGMVAAGCAAAMKHFTAACVTGGNPEKLIRIPDLSGFDKFEVIIPRHSRNSYDHAVRNIGVKVITVETPEEMRQAISKHTAMIYMITSPRSATGQPFSLEVMAEIAKPHNIPILVDAAAEDLTIPPVHLARGGTVVAYSGGKAICGPQCAGLLLGDKKLLQSAWQASSPHHGPGRDNKVGKEEMMGMLAAVEAWTTRDHQKEWDTWVEWLDYITKQVTKVKGVTTEVKQPRDLNNRAPMLVIKWDPQKMRITGEQVAEDCARKPPRLAIGSQDNEQEASVNVTPNQMQAGQEKIVAERLVKLLKAKRSPLKKELKAPEVDLTGHWQVDIEFFSSTSTHTLYLQQDGNWLQGTHQGDFDSREVLGMVEGKQVKIRSGLHIPGDHVTFLFHGTAENGSMKGSVFLGEYLNAKFKATKATYSVKRKNISVPGGPPLAT